MPPNKNQSNYSKRPIRRVRLLKLVPKKTKSLFEEYFYAFVGMISVAVMILGKAGGLSGYNAVVTGMWVGGFTWFAWMLRRYWKEQASGAKSEKAKQAEVQADPAPAVQTTGAPSNPNKPVFVYERPTLPDRKPKLPNNWPGRRDKKPKR